MTRNQILSIDSVRTKLQECRELLDGVMYYSEPITDEEHTTLRSAYDSICQATDKL